MAKRRRHEAMEVEFIGGPLDRSRLHVDVVREDATHIRVLAASYEQTFKALRAADVEQEGPA